MTYKEMTDIELQQEIKRVRTLIYSKCNSHTYHQNKKYLEKLEKEFRNREKKNY